LLNPQKKMKIVDIKAFKVLNSRADWTLRTEVVLEDGSRGFETVPDGASKGENEAIYVPIESALEVVNEKLNKALKGMDAADLSSIDQAMMNIDGTENKRVLGANSILSVSLAAVKACAASEKKPLYKYLSETFGYTDNFSLPTPVFNVINGGKHANSGLSFQEFMVIPGRKVPYDQALEMGVNVYKKLKKNLSDQGFDIDVGDEGGFAPSGLTPQKALHFIKEASSSLYEPGGNIFFGLDVAAESFWQSGSYNIAEENLVLDRSGLRKYYANLFKSFEIVYIEDPFYENDREGWESFNKDYKKITMIVADDLVVTNPGILQSAVENDLANAVIVKPNQVGTLTETIQFIKKAQKNKWGIVVSHRSGDTAEDTFISDLAVAVGAEFIKSGAPARGERVAKYNRLLEIFHDLNSGK
jgi:enolase